MLNIWNSLEGMLKIQLTSADYPETIRSMGQRGIILHSIWVKDSLTVQFLIARKDYRKMEREAEKRGDHLKILGKQGISWKITGLVSRPVLVCGIAFLLFFFLMLPTRVLFIEVSGNTQLPENRILEAAAVCGIHFGASRKEVRSEQVKNALLERIPELKWAGVNTRGCVAEISVKERDTASEILSGSGPASIIAQRDGIIEEYTLEKGSVLCKPGQAVRKGQVLISGLTDCGNKIQAVQARGDVFARTFWKIKAVTPNFASMRKAKQAIHRTYFLIVGKKRIKIAGSSGNSDATCGRMYEEYYITLPGGFLLPLALAIDEYSYWSLRTEKKDPAQSRAFLCRYADRYLYQQMAAGTILHRKESFSEKDGLFHLQGQYLCREMIGRLRQEQTGE